MSPIIVNAAQRHSIVTLQGIDTTWATMAGGGKAAVTMDDPDTDTGTRLVVVGETAAENIVLTTGFDPRHDQEWINELKRGIGTFRGTVTRQWTDENWTHLGEPEVYPDCLLIGYTPPVSTRSGDEAVFTITLATSGEAL